MILKYTSSKEVIAKIFTDLDLQEESHRIADMREWISEGLEKIGAVTQLTRLISGVDAGADILPVVNYQAALPTGLVRVEQAAFSFSENGIYQPMKYATGTMGMNSLNADYNLTTYSSTTPYYIGDKVQYTSIDGNTRIYICKLTHNANGSTPVIPDTINNTTWMVYIPYSPLITGDTVLQDLQYQLKPSDGTHDYIVTNVKEGFIKLAYDALNSDSDGYPLVPDIASYKEALYWYVTMKLKYPEYLRGTLQRDIYYDIRRSWNFYRQQAYAEALMPGNTDQMESIKNTWLRLVPEINEHSSFYSSLNQPQTIYNNGRVF
jgi:hypothetical protein